MDDVDKVMVAMVIIMASFVGLIVWDSHQAREARLEALQSGADPLAVECLL